VARDHHHVVTAGLLRHFADGQRIRLVDKHTATSKIVGVRNTFVMSGFNTMRTDTGPYDDVEDEWARLENATLPPIRAAIDRHDLAAASDELKVLAAVHVARSYLTRAVFDQAFTERQADPTGGMDMGLLQSAFREEYGRAPERGEIEAVVADHIDLRHRDNSMFVHELVNLHNKVLAKLWPLHIQPVWLNAPRRTGLVIGDVPVVRITAGGLRVTAALGDAEAIYMPLAPAAGVSFTTRPEPAAAATPLDVLTLNSYLWRSAQRYVACHPATDWRHALLL